MSNKLFSVYREENTPEYKIFKTVSDEDSILAEIIKQKFGVGFQKILDVGGRSGEVSTLISEKNNITIIDPDTDLVDVIDNEIHFINERIQDVALGKSSYDLVIASHVWGDLSRDNVSKKVLAQLMLAKKDSASLVICHNHNSGFLRDLQYFAFNYLSGIRYDNFDTSILIGCSFHTEYFETCLNYKTFEELARACWFLFATGDQEIEEVVKIFQPYLESVLEKPEFSFEQEVHFVN